MTHEELLERVSKIKFVSCDENIDLEPVHSLLELTESCNECLTCMGLSALRAIVELHKPIDNPNFTDSDRWCWQCADGRGYAKYPCPTIQVIEKELT